MSCSLAIYLRSSPSLTFTPLKMWDQMPPTMPMEKGYQKGESCDKITIIIVPIVFPILKVNMYLLWQVTRAQDIAASTLLSPVEHTLQTPVSLRLETSNNNSVVSHVGATATLPRSKTKSGEQCFLGNILKSGGSGELFCILSLFIPHRSGLVRWSHHLCRCTAQLLTVWSLVFSHNAFTAAPVCRLLRTGNASSEWCLEQQQMPQESITMRWSIMLMMKMTAVVAFIFQLWNHAPQHKLKVQASPFARTTIGAVIPRNRPAKSTKQQCPVQ